MNIPKLPPSTTPFLYGLITGAVALAIVGFNWGGWVTGGTHEEVSVSRANAATVAALSPICVAQFRNSPDAAAKLAELKKIESWQRSEFVSKGGWATFPGGTGEPNSAVASACADSLNSLPS